MAGNEPLRRRREKAKEKGASVISLVVAGLKDPPSDIRPQAFPLGLLAPRLLCAVLFLANTL